MNTDIERNFDALWPLLSECKIPELKGLGPVPLSEIDKASIQTHYGDSDEKSFGLLKMIFAALVARRGETWREFIAELPREMGYTLAQMVICSDPDETRTLLKRYLKGKNWKRFDGTVDEIRRTERAGRQD